MRAAVTLLPLLLGSVAVTCADPNGPGAFAGEYELIAEDGRALPRLLFATQGCDEWLTGGLLTLGPGETFTLDLYEQIDCTRGGGGVQDGGRTYPGTFTVRTALFRAAGVVLTLTSPRQQGEPFVFSGSVLRGTVSVEIGDPQVSAWGSLRPAFRRL